MSARLSEAEVHWRAFLEDLAGRGLKGVKLVVSDDHAGLRAARTGGLSCPALAALPVSSEPECATFCPSPGRERGEIGQAMRDSFNSPTLEDAEAMLKRKIQALSETNQALAQWMEENVRKGADGLRLPPKPAPEDPEGLRSVPGIVI